MVGFCWMCCLVRVRQVSDADILHDHLYIQPTTIVIKRDMHKHRKRVFLGIEFSNSDCPHGMCAPVMSSARVSDGDQRR